MIPSVKYCMMDSSLIDPNNHVPEVTPDDVWGDPEGVRQGLHGSITILPPKRSKGENQASPASTETEGLRIEARPQRRQTDETEQKLEVQEIDGTVVRLDPEIPAAPRIPRQVAFHEKPPEVEVDPIRRGESREWGYSRMQSVRWIVGTGVGIASLVILAMMLLPLINKSNAARQGNYGLVLDPNEDVKGAEALNAMLSRQSEAEQVFRKFASASIVNDVLPVVRDRGTVEPLIRRDFRPSLVSKDWLPPDETTWSVFDLEGKAYGVLEGRLPDYSKFSAYLMLSEDQLHLDWKATTGYGTANFEELEKGQGNPAEIRAMISPSGYYTAAFPEADFRSYQCVSPDGVTAIWCYTRRGDAADVAIGKLFASGEIIQSSEAPRKVALRLERGPEDSLPNQWLIAGMLHKDWIIP